MSATKPTPPDEAKQTEHDPEASADRIDAPVADEPTTVAAPEPDLTSRLTERLARRKQERAAEQEQDCRMQRERAWNAYLPVVLGSSAPTEQEFEDFVDACSTLNIEPAHIERHQRIVTKARKAEAEWDEHCKNKDALPAKQNALGELRLQFAPQLKLLRNAESEVSTLQNSIYGTQQAADRLKKLAEATPELFDHSVQPPRLLPAEPDRPASGPAVG